MNRIVGKDRVSEERIILRLSRLREYFLAQMAGSATLNEVEIFIYPVKLQYKDQRSLQPFKFGQRLTRQLRRW